MNTTIKIILSILSIIQFGCEDINDTSVTFGPFNPVSNVDDIIILGDNSTFVAFNVKTKKTEETYKIPKGFVREYAYLSGHLILTVQSGGRYNINVKTGEVGQHAIPYSAIGYTPVLNKNEIEATDENGYKTLRFNPVENRIINTYKHPIAKFYSADCIERNDTIFWTSERGNNIINSYGQSFVIHSRLDIESYGFRNHGFVNHVVAKSYNNWEGATVTLEKLKKVYPFETTPFFKMPFESESGINDTMLYKDKVLAFCSSETYLIDSNGQILYRWGDYGYERDYSLNHKSIRGRISKTIIGDKLYVFGQRYNSQTQVQKNCCVEIDLETGIDQWIEVWEGW